jgi:cyanophycinase
MPNWSRNEAFEYLNAMNVGVLYIEKQEEAADEVVLERLREADIMMFTGGDNCSYPFLELSFHDLLLNTIMKSLFADFSRVQHQTV